VGERKYRTLVCNVSQVFRNMKLEEEVVEILKKKKLTLATAESCTGGLLSNRITNIPGASEVYIGGVVAYSNDVKVKVLGVSPLNLEKYGAVSEEVAREMATGICKLTGAVIGIGITGIAGPSGGTALKPVGLVYIGIFDTITGRIGVFKNNFTGSREEIKFQSAEAGLRVILNHIDKNLNQ